MTPQERVSVVLAGLPRLLADVVAGVLEEQDDVRVVGDPVPLEDTMLAVADRRPDIVVCGVPPAEAGGLYERLQATHPDLRVVELVADGRTARVHGKSAADLGDASMLSLVAAVRGRPSTS
jgi:hypothetical protein